MTGGGRARRSGNATTVVVLSTAIDSGDWLWWLLMDAFALGYKGFFGEWYQDAFQSLRITLDYSYCSHDPGDEYLEGLADRIRELFPEWPL